MDAATFTAFKGNMEREVKSLEARVVSLTQSIQDQSKAEFVATSAGTIKSLTARIATTKKSIAGILAAISEEFSKQEAAVLEKKPGPATAAPKPA
ncbi:MAG: hypothetical protein ABSE62_05085 [Chthoniobacteraceae bacterium]|jgi:predicted  nucleic acid-binding Zn-ribbon protein